MSRGGRVESWAADASRKIYAAQYCNPEAEVFGNALELAVRQIGAGLAAM
jgi:hypothetical protein